MKKNLISIVILALLIVNIVLTAVMMFSVVSTNKKTAALVTDVAAAVNLDLGGGEEEEQVEAVSMESIVPYTIADMTIPLKKGEDGKDHYALFNITLSMNNEHDDFKTYGDLTTREDLIKGQINEVVSQYTLEEISADPQAVKEGILQKIQELFDSDFIFDVTLSSTLYQ